jgi:hypothetical protein
MSPRYETEQDLSREWAIGVEFARQFNATIRKLPESKRYFCDLGVFREGQMVAIVEIKDRPGWKLPYGDVILGLSKVRELQSYNDMMGVPAFFVARLAGEIHFAKINEDVKNWYIRWGGRTDRDDAADQEPVVHIPYSSFRKLG